MNTLFNLSLEDYTIIINALHYYKKVEKHPTFQCYDEERINQLRDKMAQQLIPSRNILEWILYSYYSSSYYLLLLWRWHGVSNEQSKWSHGGLEPTSTNILRLLSELEGAYQLTKYMAFDEDNAILDSMKQRYYKLYRQTVKHENIH